MWAMFNVLDGDGHLLPMVPLARELKAAGHEVTFVTSSPNCAAVERQGFPALGVEPPPITTAASGDRLATMGELRGDDRLRFAYVRLLEVSVAHARGIVELCNRRRPDVLIRETTALGAWMAGELLDVPVACWEFAPMPARQVASVLGDGFQAARAEVGLSPDNELATLDRWLTILGGPPGWFPPEVFGPTTHLFQPFSDPDSGDSLPDWFSTLPDRPNLYVTLGGRLNRTPGVFELIFDAVEDVDANVIVTVGQTIDPAAFGSLPDHVRVERFISQGLVLPHCDAVVAHGGYGSLMGALRHGLPVVAIPLAVFDNSVNAARVEHFGAGIAVTQDERSVDSVRHAVLAVLEQPRYRDAAQKIATEMAGLPPFTDSVGLIERLARDRQPILAR